MKKHLISQQEYYYRVRADCAWKLLALVMNNEPIVYVDETTVSVNIDKNKTWQRADQAIYAPRNSTVLKTITVYAAVANPSVLQYPLFYSGASTDGL